MEEGTPIVPSIEDQRLDLVHRCIAGDEDAWRQFYDEYARTLPALIHDYRLTTDFVGQVVHDFMAHLFMRRCAVLGSYHLVAGVRFESWLRIVFRRFTLRWLRTMASPRWDPSLDPGDVIERDQPKETVDPAIVLSIYRAINKLGERDGAIVSLLLDGRPYAEIGGRLGMNEPAVAVAVQRLRGRLRHLLLREGLGSASAKGFSSKKAHRRMKDDHALPD